MSTLAIGTYCRFQNRNGVDQGLNLQNFFAGESRSFGGVSYTFANFAFSGSAVDSTGANIQAQLIFALTQLVINTVKNASDNNWIVRVQTVWLNPTTLAETGQFVSETYAVLGYDHDSSRLAMRLGSPLDAITANVPRRVLSTPMVGALPGTGAIPLA